MGIFAILFLVIGFPLAILMAVGVLAETRRGQTAGIILSLVFSFLATAGFIGERLSGKNPIIAEESYKTFFIDMPGFSTIIKFDRPVLVHQTQTTYFFSAFHNSKTVIEITQIE